MDTIFLVGELALSFLCLSKRFQLRRYSQRCAPYHGVCSTLLAKARMRGCRLRWPSDMVFGDLEVSAEDRMKCFLKVEADARNEGVDYEGEVKVARVSDAEGDSGGVEPIVLTGFAYDIGPDTIAALKETLLASDLVLAWGTVGMCESSAFQAGQQCLVDFGTAKPPAETPAIAPALTRNPLRSVLLGDSTVEWCTRFLDSDGELGGDLVGAGLASYACRESSALCGLMGLFPSRMAQGCLTMRTPLESEFVYSQMKPPVDDEEDEDEDEEEED